MKVCDILKQNINHLMNFQKSDTTILRMKFCLQSNKKHYLCDYICDILCVEAFFHGHAQKWKYGHLNIRFGKLWKTWSTLAKIQSRAAFESRTFLMLTFLIQDYVIVISSMFNLVNEVIRLSTSLVNQIESQNYIWGQVYCLGSRLHEVTRLKTALGFVNFTDHYMASYILHELNRQRYSGEESVN